MDKIMTYLTQFLKQTERTATRNHISLSKYEDIKSEFEKWIDSQEFPSDGLKVNGYTALNIHQLAPFMTGVGVYNFLVTLREKPQYAEKVIADGFPMK